MDLEILNELKSKFTKFAYWKDIKDLSDIKDEFFNIYDNQYWYRIVEFYDSIDLKSLFIN